jgi:membrane protease YdiL (CAAX protease family)
LTRLRDTGFGEVAQGFMFQVCVSFLASCILGAVLVLIITVVLRLLGAVQIESHQNGVARRGQIVERIVANPLWLLVFAAVEELFARALLIGWLGHYTGLPVAFAVSAVVFAVLHIPNGRPTIISMLNLVLVTIVFGIVYMRFGLWAAIGMHYGWNLMQWPVLGYPMYGRQVGWRLSIRAVAPEWLSGGEFGPEYSVVASVVLALCIVGAAVV